LGILLPVLLFGATNKKIYTLFSRADDPKTLRVWLEPKTVLTSPGKEVVLSVMVALDKEGDLLPSVSVPLVADAGMSVSSSRVVYTKPFGGSLSIGSVRVHANEKGTYTLSIPKEQLDTAGILVPSITTDVARVIVR
jgi:hypothetical protein